MLPRLTDDVAGLVRATGAPRAHIGGHDWGGVIAWTFAAEYPELTDRLLIFNAPHPQVYARTLASPRQFFRSWYVLLFLVPGLAERLLLARGGHALRRMFARGPARPGTFSREDVDAYVSAMSTPGALTAALNYYRANAGLGRPGATEMRTISSETLIVWGEQDPALSVAQLEGLRNLVPNLRVHRLPDVGHWVQNEAPDQVNRVILAFLGEPGDRPAPREPLERMCL